MPLSCDAETSQAGGIVRSDVADLQAGEGVARDSFGSLLRTLNLIRDELRLLHYIDVSMVG